MKKTAGFNLKNAQATLARRQEALDHPLSWKNRKFANPQHVKNYLGSLLNRVEAGLLDDQKASRLANIAQILVHAMRDDDLKAVQMRVNELEKRLEAAA